MRTIIRDNYDPTLNQYHETIVVDEAREKRWLFDCDGVFHDITKVNVVSERGDSEEYAASQKWVTEEVQALEAADQALQDNIDAEESARIAADETLQDNIEAEEADRIAADTEIWDEIEAIEAASDVVDIVGTYAELQQYDTSALKDNDIIKVLADETHDDAIAYYRWSTSTEAFTFVGVEGPYYTASETDTLLATKQDKLIAGSNIQIAADGKTISATDTTYTAGTNVSIDANNVISATDTTYSDFTGATSSAAGTNGLVPAPAAGDEDKYLKGDGTWAAVQTGGSAVVDFYLDAPLDSIMMGGGSNINVYKDQAKTIAATMKDIYDAALDGGARLNYFYLNGSTVEGARSWMSAGTYYDLDDNWYSTAFTPAGDAFSVLYYIGGGALVTYIDVTNWAAKAVLQPKLTAGSNISITTSGATNTISATDTTYSDFTGATSSVAGANGLVPAPAAGDEGKFLKGDGTWDDAGSSATLFYIDYAYISPSQSTSVTLYSDLGMTTPVTSSEYVDAMLSGDDVKIVSVVPDVDPSNNTVAEIVDLITIQDNDYDRTTVFAYYYISGKIMLISWDTASDATPYIRPDMEIQQKLVAGSNIQIAADGKTISSTDTTYTAGSNISISAQNVISATVPATNNISSTDWNTLWQ